MSDVNVDKPVVNKVADVIVANIKTFSAAKKKVQDFHDRANANLVRLKEGETLDVNSRQLHSRLRNVIRLNKRRISLYLANVGKMKLDDTKAMEVIGTYSMWQANADKVSELQDIILDTIYIEKQTIKCLTETISLLKQTEDKA